MIIGHASSIAPDLTAVRTSESPNFAGALYITVATLLNLSPSFPEVLMIRSIEDALSHLMEEGDTQSLTSEEHRLIK